MHYIGDAPPTEVPPVPRKWRIDHVENTTGSKNEYVPYSTKRPTIEPWIPPTQQK